MFLWDEPKPRRKTFSKDFRMEVWARHIGRNKPEGPCYVCRRTIHMTDFDVGHNKARAQGGTDNIANLRPICRQCNRGMGTMSIERYKAKLNGPATTTKKKPAKKKTPRSRDYDPFWGF